MIEVWRACIISPYFRLSTGGNRYGKVLMRGMATMVVRRFLTMIGAHGDRDAHTVVHQPSDRAGDVRYSLLYDLAGSTNATTEDSFDPNL